MKSAKNESKRGTISFLIESKNIFYRYAHSAEQPSATHVLSSLDLHFLMISSVLYRTC